MPPVLLGTVIHPELEEALQVQFACTGKVPLPPLTPILAEGCGRVMAQTGSRLADGKGQDVAGRAGHALILAWRTVGLTLAAALQENVSDPDPMPLARPDVKVIHEGESVL